jgi:hypothetical protein
MMARIEIKRRQYVRAGRRSADDLTDGEWAPIAAGPDVPAHGRWKAKIIKRSGAAKGLEVTIASPAA